MKYQPVTMNPEDAQLLQSRAFSIEEICRWFFNTPPILIGHSPQGQTMWGSGVEQNGLANRNAIRELEDEEPYAGGDIYTVQSNLMPVSQLGQQSSGEQAKESIRSWLGLPTFEEKK
ncbi:hypothetical protein G6F65_021234 [Rhizopus arrhizus]|nr:hypothetical protein G6F65_021234 [Rhizopus arrhizus]